MERREETPIFCEERLFPFGCIVSWDRQKLEGIFVTRRGNKRREKKVRFFNRNAIHTNGWLVERRGKTIAFLAFK